MLSPIRTLVADDHADALSAVVSMLEYDARFAVVGTATTGHEACDRAEQIQVDLVLLDVRMPGGGPVAARCLAALPDPPHVVAVSADVNPAVVEGMLAAGAVGYLAKGRLSEDLPDLLIRCTDGEIVLALP